MNDLAESLRNIDIFCRVLVRKMAQDEHQSSDSIIVEPIEKLLTKKYIVEGNIEEDSLARHLIPVPQLDQPLIDILENDKNITVLMNCRCENQRISIRRLADGLEICGEECQEIHLPVNNLRVENASVKCNNNVLEIGIPK